MIKSLVKKMLSFRIKERGILNPFINLEVTSLGNYQGINTDSKREIPIIVSLASSRENFEKLTLTLYSLLNQNLKPDKLILWLDEEFEDLNYLPYEITQFIKNGLEIRFVKDLGSYTKSIYAFKDFQNSIIAVADDGVYYPVDWLYKLYLSYVAHPEDIHVHKALQANIDVPYNEWKKATENTAEYKNFMLSNSGILYPPQCFTREVLRKDIFIKYANNADSAWFWIMALVHKRKIRIVENNLKTTIYTNIIKHLKNSLQQKKQDAQCNDNAIKALLKFYGENIYDKLKK